MLVASCYHLPFMFFVTKVRCKLVGGGVIAYFFIVTKCTYCCDAEMLEHLKSWERWVGSNNHRVWEQCEQDNNDLDVRFTRYLSHDLWGPGNIRNSGFWKDDPKPTMLCSNLNKHHVWQRWCSFKRCEFFTVCAEVTCTQLCQWGSQRVTFGIWILDRFIWKTYPNRHGFFWYMAVCSWIVF